ncbi:hypothetical protein [Tepidibacter mesophilus]|uniref:hypothetical protein n=1 Tax=Tepidibacter mesophilus TaxID=655607 RepID=UPI000C0694EB|nr:hypothetical protein [Tepidibacter mesophilus]
MKKLKIYEDILSIVTLIVFFIVFIFYRHNIIASCILATLLWIETIITILRIRTLPKPDYYIHKPIIAKYFRGIIGIICTIMLIKYIFMINTKEFNKEFDGFIIIFTPMILRNIFSDDRRIYFYDKGIVFNGEILEFDNIDFFQWKNGEDCKFNLFYYESAKTLQ